MIDPRGTEVASELRPDPTFTYEASVLPLQVALQEMLRPSALRADVRENSVVITADTAELARHGIGTSVWINVDEDAAKKIQDALSTEITVEFVDQPLESALLEISEMLEVQISLDIQSLEAIGLTPDTPISEKVSSIKASTLLDVIIQPLELTYTIQRERLVVTTQDSAEENSLNRIYWLDGLGLPPSSDCFDSIMMMIQSSIDADTWKALGGPSTMSPFAFSKEQRPGLLISTTWSTHEQVESLINTLRKTNLGPDVGTAMPPFVLPVQSQHQPTGTMSGMGGGGFGGAMGGGGAF